MKIRWILIITLIAFVALSACQSADSTGQQTSEESTTTEQPSGEEQTQGENTDAYPAPVVEDTGIVAYPDPLYPDVQDGEEVTWTQAKAMIINGEVGAVRIISDSAHVTLAMKDGRLIVVVVDDIMDVHNAIAECGTTCRNLLVEQD